MALPVKMAGPAATVEIPVPHSSNSKKIAIFWSILSLNQAYPALVVGLVKVDWAGLVVHREL
jgi:hypothetical protein